jgi:hypothetical protein
MFGEACLQTSFDITVVAKTTSRLPEYLTSHAHLHHYIDAGSVAQSYIADEQAESNAHQYQMKARKSYLR